MSKKHNKSSLRTLNYIKSLKDHEHYVHYLILLLSILILFIEFFYAHLHFAEVIKVCAEIGLFLFIVGIKIVNWVRKYSDPMKEFWNTLNDTIVNWKATNGELHDADAFSAVLPQGAVEVEQITKLAEEAWGDPHLTSRQRRYLYEIWHTAHRKTFSLLLNHKSGQSEPVGFIIILPLNGDAHFKGERDKAHIDESLLCNRDNMASYIYIDGIYIRSNFQKEAGLSALVYKELLDKICSFAKLQEPVVIYAEAFFSSLQRFLDNLGFGKFSKKGGVQMLSNARLMVMENFEGLPLAHPARKTFYPFDIKWGEADIFLKSLSKYYHTQKQLQVPYDFFIGENIGSFFEKHCQKIEQDNDFIKSIEGKNFRFYAHSIYRQNDNKRIKKHFLATNIIQFGNVNNKYMPCNIIVPSGQHNDRYEYKFEGIASFTGSQMDVTMIFYPNKFRRNNKPWKTYTNKNNYVPIIITGRVIRDSQNQIEIDDNNFGLLAFHFTTFSYHAKNTVSKIGLLDLTPIMDEEVSLQSIIPDGNDDLLQDIKLYLMRVSKVLIKSFDDNIINSVNHINNWYENKYGRIFKKMSPEYELFYYKRSGSGKIVKSAKVNILKNGMAVLNSTRTVNGISHSDKYYGEINIRHLEENNKFLYIKFISAEPNHSSDSDHGLKQNYREVFLILFWEEVSDPEASLDFTRGVLLSDKDIEGRSSYINESVINSSVCVLCNKNASWYAHFGKDKDGVYSDHQLRDIDEKFLQHVLKARPLFLYYPELLAKIFDKNEMSELFSCFEIAFDGNGMCKYDDIIINSSRYTE